VQQFVRNLAKGYAKELFINLLDFGVVMGLAHFTAFVFLVDGLYTLHADFIGGEAGLSATANATARAAHHFDEMITGFTRTYAFNERTRIAESVGYSNICGNTFQGRTSPVRIP
jgi:hypothetical protein